MTDDLLPRQHHIKLQLVGGRTVKLDCYAGWRGECNNYVDGARCKSTAFLNIIYHFYLISSSFSLVEWFLFSGGGGGAGLDA